MSNPLFQLDNAFLENADPTRHLVVSKLRPSAKIVRFRLVDANGHEYWFIQKAPYKHAGSELISLASSLLLQLYMRWRANFDQVEIIIPTIESERTCDVSGQTCGHIYSETFIVKSFNQNGYDASKLELRTPSYVGVWRNRDFDADIDREFIRCIDQDGRILELTFHPDEAIFVRGVTALNTVMQEVADKLHSDIGLLLRTMEYICPLSGERNHYVPVYLPAE